MLKKNKQIFIYISLFFLLLVINYLLPYTNDDWAWGSSIGIDRLNNLFSNYNGRYFGNFLVLLLTRYKILKSIVISLTFTFICFFINKLLDKKNLIIPIICVMLIIVMPLPIFSQVFSWTSGFANYVPPTLLVLIWIYINKNLFLKKSIDISLKYSILVLLLGFSTVLFVEHLTLYCIFLSNFMILYCIKNKIKVNLCNYFYFFGVLLGSILMFSNSAYYNVAKGADFYRNISMSSNFISNCFIKYITIIYENLVLNNTVILFFVSFSLTIIYLKKITNVKRAKLLKISLIIMWLYTIYSIVSNIFIDYNFINISLKLVEGIFTLIYFLSLLVAILLIPNEFISKTKLLFYLGSIIILVLPLFVVSPINSRCFFTSYIFEVIFCIQLFIDMSKYIHIKRYSKLVCILLLSIIMIVFVCYMYISFSIFLISKKMIKSINIQKQEANQQMILPKLPYEYYMYQANPTIDENIKRFKLFYNIPQNIKVDFIDYKKWNVIINKK